MTERKTKALTDAYRNVFDGNGTREEAKRVLTDLMDMAGYYRRPSYAEWLVKTKTPHGFELHSALCNARAEVVQHIVKFLALTEDDLVALEKAARLEPR